MVKFYKFKLKKFYRLLRAKFAPSPLDIAFSKWIHDDGDNSLRYNYDLNKDSIVFDVGGYKGDFAAEISSRFLSNVYVFEPVENFFNFSKNRFTKNPFITLFQYGLGSKEQTLSVQEDEIRTQMKESGKGKIIKVQIRDIQAVIQELNISYIDLLKINIEGGEYELLEKIYQMGFMTKIKDIQVQFHDFVPNADQKRQDIIEKIQMSHNCTWCYPYIWENWTLK